MVHHNPQGKHIGSSFDDFLAEEGLLAEAHAVAQQRIIAFQLEQELQRRGWTRADLADRLGISHLAVDHLLDPEDLTVDLQLLARAADLLGRRLRITLR
ncbi:helix-turn-helix domain-containing protein [Deinococcus gobiensis]|uniref:helix-turn-helix domain-containing protein n=1 Tax=Deinococcus gobiensis TaxID=502394 RepID=UPI00031C5599|nr:helix-turn-helix domain-containing protein [Deinococcus gobiensis]